VVLGATPIAGTSYTYNKVATWRMSTSGVPQSPVVSTLGSSTRQTWTEFIAGDLNGDGYPDLIISEGAFSDPSGAFDIALNDHTGGFTLGQRYTTAHTVTSMAVCDVNGDHKLDVVINAAGTVLVYPGNGTGTLGIAYTAVTGFAP